MRPAGNALVGVVHGHTYPVCRPQDAFQGCKNAVQVSGISRTHRDAANSKKPPVVHQKELKRCKMCQPPTPGVKIYQKAPKCIKPPHGVIV